MNGLQDLLIERGRTAHEQETSAFQFEVPNGTRRAIYDPRNQRLKMYGLTGSEFRSSRACLQFVQSSDRDRLFTKLTVYAIAGVDEPIWCDLGFCKEGRILGYFRDHGDANLWVKYFDSERAASSSDEQHEAIVKMARAKKFRRPASVDGYATHVAVTEDADEIETLLHTTFRDYPTLISAKHIRHMIRSGAHCFRLARDVNGDLAAVVSAEIDADVNSAEMTDCATRFGDRGRGLMSYLLDRLANDVQEIYGITDLYTIARADEVGVNCVFARLGYQYTGRLVNNCRMPNGWESMNIWCKNNRDHDIATGGS